jgi:hypothetical protein
LAAFKTLAIKRISESQENQSSKPGFQITRGQGGAPPPIPDFLLNLWQKARAERSFSALRRIKSWQRNRINNSTAETLTPTLTEEAIQYITIAVISHPGRAKTRNITIWMMVMMKARNEMLMKTNYENIENIFAFYFENNFYIE